MVSKNDLEVGSRNAKSSTAEFIRIEQVNLK